MTPGYDGVMTPEAFRAPVDLLNPAHDNCNRGTYSLYAK